MNELIKDLVYMLNQKYKGYSKAEIRLLDMFIELLEEKNYTMVGLQIEIDRYKELRHDAQKAYNEGYKDKPTKLLSHIVEVQCDERLKELEEQRERLWNTL